MSDLNLTFTGQRELMLRLNEFPEAARVQILARIESLTDRMELRAEQLAPEKTGRLKSEIQGRVYSDSPSRIAGYVSVVAPDVAREYIKAASLEFGVDSVRHLRASSLIERLTRRKALAARVSREVHQRAFRYLAGAFEDIHEDAVQELSDALTEALNQSG